MTLLGLQFCYYKNEGRLHRCDHPIGTKMSTTTTTDDANEDPRKAWRELSEDDFVRGEMPADIGERCLQCCRKYLGGVWLQAETAEDIEVTRIKGGLTNQLYKVTLAPHIADRHVETEHEPHAVAVKLYEPKHVIFVDNKVHDAFERLPDAIILSMASLQGLTPKVYGIFPEGFVQRFHEV